MRFGAETCRRNISLQLLYAWDPFSFILYKVETQNSAKLYHVWKYILFMFVPCQGCRGQSSDSLREPSGAALNRFLGLTPCQVRARFL